MVLADPAFATKVSVGCVMDQEEFAGEGNTGDHFHSSLPIQRPAAQTRMQDARLVVRLPCHQRFLLQKSALCWPTPVARWRCSRFHGSDFFVGRLSRDVLRQIGRASDQNRWPPATMARADCVTMKDGFTTR